MGRYYNGDIDGKFWFGVQSSDDANFFGYEATQPEYLEYMFEKEHEEKVKEGIHKCEEELGEYKEKIKRFFEKNNSYNEEIVKQYGFNIEEFNEKIVWYARLKLGEKILKSIVEKGQCYFDAEL